MSIEPTITCPRCKTQVKLTESLAAPLIESTRAEYERRLTQEKDAIALREKAIREREAAVAREKEATEQKVQELLRKERTVIAAEESRKARAALGNELSQREQAVAELQETLKSRDAKLAEAQKAQAEVLRKQRDLDDARRELDLTVEKRINEGLGAARELAKKDAEQAIGLKVAEKEQTITSLQKHVDDLKRKLEQGSQQVQGEVLELQLETLLAARFPHDQVEPVPKGEHGGDILHRVFSPIGQPCGTLIWESKRTKNWSDGWLAKLREDQRKAKAEVAIIVSSVLPAGVETFDQIDGVWVAHPRAAFPVALALRQMLLEVSTARKSTEGQQTKTELVYQYLMGNQFRLRVQAIVEAFSTMRADLDKERKSIMKQWAKREAQIDLVMQATVGLYGDLQGIAGANLQEIEGLDLKQLESEDDQDE